LSSKLRIVVALQRLFTTTTGQSQAFTSVATKIMLQQISYEIDSNRHTAGKRYDTSPRL